MSKDESQEPGPEPLHPERLTWAVLLSQWVDFARQAVGLPKDEAGQRMRDSVPDLIMLQAVWFALKHLDELDPAEQALGLDRAEVLIDKHTAALNERWSDNTMPEGMRELMRDARDQLEQARQALRDRGGPSAEAGDSEPSG